MGQYLEKIQQALIEDNGELVEKTLEELLAAKSANPGDARLLEDLARAYFALDRHVAAAAVCEELVGLEEERPEPYEIAAQAFFFKKDYEKASELARRALGLNPISPLAEHLLRHAEKKLKK